MPTFVPTTARERDEMLRSIGVQSVEQLFEDIPAQFRKPELDVPPGLSELEALRHLRALSEQNLDLDHHPCFLGAGAYRHFTPSIIGHLVTRGEFLTSYTPYQPEVAQGTLQAMYEWQSLVCELTGMDISNAAVYDAATGVGEAARMACAITRRKKVLVADTVSPLYREVLRTYGGGPGIEIATFSAFARDGERLTRTEDLAAQVDDSTACLIIQNPNFLGWLENCDGLAERLAAKGALLVVIADPASLGLLRPPGEYGAGIVVGEGKWTGGPLDFGGPQVGLFACKSDYVRQLPGRIAGATVDRDGTRGYVLTFTTREQHIRREKATSNICTSEALIALCTTIYLCQLGKQGLREVAEQCVQKSHYLASQVGALDGYSVVSAAPYVKEFVLKCPRPAAEVNRALLDRGIIGGFDLGRYVDVLADCLLLCCTEMTQKSEMDQLVAALKEID
ncbi:MAG TPA: aminomethyl-transferring glycine dehydrogenase subunit GcvPA [Chloroflexota bacterium]|nr:aminomethyl-transferring glycine dehydrogenase subunit GcvPA [Chloroflexota bacterium]